MPKPASKRFDTRIPTELYEAFHEAAKKRGGTPSAAAREAIREWVDRERVWSQRDDLEERIAATMTRVMKDIVLVRNDIHVQMAFFDAYMRSYFLHTPPVPREALDAAAAAAQDRYEKLLKQVPQLLQDGGGFADLLADETSGGKAR